MKINLPLRTGVGVIVLGKNNTVFVGKRKDNPVDKWQMPQGGVDNGEDYEQAMRRELHEETSIKSTEIVKIIEKWLIYDLPPSLLGKIWKGRFRGQRQKWFITKFTGADNEININTKHPEFIEWKWINYKELPKVIVDFKKDVYLKLVKEIQKILI